MTDMEKQPLLEAEPSSTPEVSTAADGEPSLHDLQQRVFAAQREYMKAWSRTTSGKWHKRIMWMVTGILLAFVAFCFSIIIMESLDDDPWLDGPTRVPFEAHIMSKCPDARDCLHDMILPAMQNVSWMVDFKLSFIGELGQTDDDDQVKCMHGPEECLGNIIELCAAKHYPNPKIYLGFTMCLSRDYAQIPQRALIEDCALEHGISVDKLNRCAMTEDGQMSLDMLKKSVNHTANAGVTRSCTIRVDNEVRCIRDGGEWKDCEGGSTAQDLVRDITGKYRDLDVW